MPGWLGGAHCVPATVGVVWGNTSQEGRMPQVWERVEGTRRQEPNQPAALLEHYQTWRPPPLSHCRPCSVACSHICPAWQQGLTLPSRAQEPWERAQLRHE